MNFVTAINTAPYFPGSDGLLSFILGKTLWDTHSLSDILSCKKWCYVFQKAIRSLNVIMFSKTKVQWKKYCCFTFRGKKKSVMLGLQPNCICASYQGNHHTWYIQECREHPISAHRIKMMYTQGLGLNKIHIFTAISRTLINESDIFINYHYYVDYYERQRDRKKQRELLGLTLCCSGLSHRLSECWLESQLPHFWSTSLGTHLGKW